MVPLVLLLLFTLFSSSPYSDDTPFSMDRTGAYTVHMTTMRGVDYFVTPSFKRRYTHDTRTMYQVEEMAEREYVRGLDKRCNVEKTKQKQALNEAKKVKGLEQSELLMKAHNMGMPSCDRMKEFMSSD